MQIAARNKVDHYGPGASKIVILLRLVLVVALASCTNRTPPEVSGLFTDVRVVDEADQPIGDVIRATAGDGVTLQLSLLPLFRMGEQIEGRPIKAPKDWRVLASLKDQNGTLQALIQSNSGEFFNYDWIGVESLILDGPRKVHLWFGPDPPDQMDPEKIYLWGHIRTPLKPGEYTLTLSCFPSPTPFNSRDLVSDLGPAQQAFQCTLLVEAATPGKEPILSRLYASMRADTAQRKAMRKYEPVLSAAEIAELRTSGQIE